MYIKQYASRADSNLLPTLINLLVQGRKFEEALHYLSILNQNNGSTSGLQTDVIMMTLFNGIELNFKNIDSLKTLIQKYYSQRILTKDQVAVYNGLLTFTRGDHNNYSYFMDQIHDPALLSRKENFQKMKQQYLSYPDAPSSYLDALIAMELFKK